MSSSQNLIHHPCLVCCRPTSMWCSRCQTSWYCSAEHLQSDWPRHRRECNPAPAQQSPIIDGASGSNGVPAGHGVPSHHVVIQTPPPAVPELMTVSALLFLPNQGMSAIFIPSRTSSLNAFSLFSIIDRRSTRHPQCSLTVFLLPLPPPSSQLMLTHSRVVH